MTRNPILWLNRFGIGKLPGDVLLTAKTSAGCLDIIADGTIYLLTELGEQLAWLSAALHPSPPGSGVVYCKPSSSVLTNQQKINPTREQDQEGQPDCIVQIGFHFEATQDDSEANGSCWQHLFRQAVVVKGYPILKRPAPDTGLEVPLEIVGSVAGSQGITVFSNSLIIRALGMIMVHTGQFGGVVLWHVVSSKVWENDQLPGHYMGIDLERNVGDGRFQLRSLFALRHIIGCESAEKLRGKAMEFSQNESRSFIDRCASRKPSREL